MTEDERRDSEDVVDCTTMSRKDFLRAVGLALAGVGLGVAVAKDLGAAERKSESSGHGGAEKKPETSPHKTDVGAPKKKPDSSPHKTDVGAPRKPDSSGHKPGKADHTVKTTEKRITALHKMFDDPNLSKKFLENPHEVLKAEGIKLTDRQIAVIKNGLTDKMAGKPYKIDVTYKVLRPNARSPWHTNYSDSGHFHHANRG